ncbi:peptide-methionine (R)-S-oxide reductase MsrB [Sphingobium subterraneum]|nr:peptide-methionine (R)-S-oxide reductase MsrB [Sphingobium subterraneum]
MISRRTLLAGGVALGAAAIAGSVFPWIDDAEARAYPFQLTDAQWRSRLTPQQYAILREKATERPFTHPLNHEKRKGTFRCAGCEQPLFASRTKFDSGTGWPSFYQPLPGRVGTSTDRDLGYARTEVHCARCGGHLGHVFDDGPRPTGLRYCMNGGAMTFAPATG